MKNLFAILTFLFVLTAFVYAQGGVTGKWTGEQQGRGGSQPVTLELKADGSKLTGSMTTGQNTMAISDGTVDGSKISFKTTANFNGNEVQISYSGEVKGDELSLTREFAGGRGGRGGGGGGRGGAQPLVLKRAK